MINIKFLHIVQNYDHYSDIRLQLKTHQVPFGHSGGATRSTQIKINTTHKKVPTPTCLTCCATNWYSEPLRICHDEYQNKKL